MKSPRPVQLLCTAILLTLTLVAPPAAEANPLKTIRSSLKKLNPFRKNERQAESAPAPKPAPKAKPVVAKSTKPTPAKKKTSTSSTTKKSAAAVTAGTAGAAAATSSKKDKGDKEAKDEKEGSGETPEASGESAASEGETPPASDAAETPPATPAEIPFGTPVMGRKGHVRSPFAEDQGMVDVTDIPAGSKVKCPFTGKVFRVP